MKSYLRLFRGIDFSPAVLRWPDSLHFDCVSSHARSRRPRMSYEAFLRLRFAGYGRPKFEARHCRAGRDSMQARLRGRGIVRRNSYSMGTTVLNSLACVATLCPHSRTCETGRRMWMQLQGLRDRKGLRILAQQPSRTASFRWQVVSFLIQGSSSSACTSFPASKFSVKLKSHPIRLNFALPKLRTLRDLKLGFFLTLFCSEFVKPAVLMANAFNIEVRHSVLSMRIPPRSQARRRHLLSLDMGMHPGWLRHWLCVRQEIILIPCRISSIPLVVNLQVTLTSTTFLNAIKPSHTASSVRIVLLPCPGRTLTQ
jgi:hypothetical protein